MIIGLGYKKQSGKDTVADYLVSHHGFVKKSFATPLKQLCFYITEHRLGKYTDSEAILLIGNWFTKYDVSHSMGTAYGVVIGLLLKEIHQEPIIFEEGKPRKLLQMLGTDVFRTLDQDFLINCMRIDVDTSVNPNIVITDVRFENDKAFVESIGAAVCIHRPGIVNTDTHASEISLDNAVWKYHIMNTQGLDMLYEQVEDLLVVLHEGYAGCIL